MAKGKEVSLDSRQTVIKKHKGGLSIRQIAKDLLLKKSTVHSILKKHAETGSVANKPRIGRPKMLSTRDARAIHRIVSDFPRMAATLMAKE